MDNNEQKEVTEVKQTTPEEKKDDKGNVFKTISSLNKKKEPKEPMDKQDKLCWAGFIGFLLIAFFPTFLQTIDPVYDRDAYFAGPVVEEPQVAVKKMNCQKTFVEKGFHYLVDVTGVYENSNVKSVEFKYLITLEPTSGLTLEDITIPEYESIIGIESEGINYKENMNELYITINYKLDSKLKDHELLVNHSKLIQFQREEYTNQNYTCNLL